MAETLTATVRGSHTIRLPIEEPSYHDTVEDPQKFRQWLDHCYQQMPELFPENFDQGYCMKDLYVSLKLDLTIRRIELRDGTSYTVHPSFVMPYLIAHTDDIRDGLLLRKYGVPFWILAQVCGRDPDFWFRAETSLGRLSIVGTTIRRAELPEHLLADEHHRTRDGEKNYIATTVAEGCCLGAEVAESAGADDLTAAYDAFRQEAQNVKADFAPQTVNTDGWKSTKAAWKKLFPHIVVLQCFLHAWLKIRERAKHLKDVFGEVRQRVWNAYHSPSRGVFSQRLRRLLEWGRTHLEGVVWEKVQDLCQKRDQWKVAFDYPQGHRTSNMLDRVMRSMNRYFDDGQHLHGKLTTARRHCRAWALLYNFTPWHPATTKVNDGWRSPVERLNQHRYHDDWLQNLLISGSLGGFRGPPRNP